MENCRGQLTKSPMIQSAFSSCELLLDFSHLIRAAPWLMKFSSIHCTNLSWLINKWHWHNFAYGELNLRQRAVFTREYLQTVGNLDSSCFHQQRLFSWSDLALHMEKARIEECDASLLPLWWVEINSVMEHLNKARTYKWSRASQEHRGTVPFIWKNMNPTVGRKT